MFCQVVQEVLALGLPAFFADAGGPHNLVTPCCTVLLLPTAVAHLVAERHRY